MVFAVISSLSPPSRCRYVYCVESESLEWKKTPKNGHVVICLATHTRTAHANVTAHTHSVLTTHTSATPRTVSVSFTANNLCLEMIRINISQRLMCIFPDSYKRALSLGKENPEPLLYNYNNTVIFIRITEYLNTCEHIFIYQLLQNFYS